MLEEHEHKHAVHEFDGIIENRVSTPPVYFTILFYGLIIWGVAFCAFYLLSGWSSQAEFEQKMAAYQEEHQQAGNQQSSSPEPDEQKSVAATAEPEEVDGAEIYSQHCAMCHGKQLEGGIGPSLVDSEATYGLSHDAVRESIADGRPNGMPAFASQLSSSEIDQLTDYVVSSSQAAEPEEKQQTSPSERSTETDKADQSIAESDQATSQSIDADALYANHCAMCHGADGKGGIGPDMTDQKYIYGKSQSDVVESITNGRPNGMPAFGNKLKEAEINALAEYVRAL